MNEVKSLFFLSRNTFIGAAASYCATLLLARYLGPSDFGSYSYVLVLGSLCSLFINFSTDATAASSYSRSQNFIETVSAVYSLRLISYIFFSLLVFIFGFEDKELAFGIIAMNLAQLNLSCVFELRMRNVQYSMLFMFERISFAGLISLIVFFEVQITLFMLFFIFFLNTAGSLVVQSFIIFPSFGSLNLRLHGAWRIVSENLFLVFAGLCSFVYGGISRIFLESNLGVFELGVYSAGWQYILIVTIFTSQVNRVFRVRFADALVDFNLVKLKRNFLDYLLLSTLPIIVVSMFFYSLGIHLNDFLFGSEFSGVNVMVPWLCIYFLVINFDALGLMLWTAQGNRGKYLLISVFWSVILIICLWSVPNDATLERYLGYVVVFHGLSVFSLLLGFYLSCRGFWLQSRQV